MNDRIGRLFAELPDDVDSVLITSDVNRRYFTGMKSSAGTLLAIRNKKSYFLIDFRYTEKARNVVKDMEVVEQKNLYKQINEIMDRNHVKNTAIESQTMTVSMLDTLKRSLICSDINSTEMLSNAINSLRMIKDKGEIENIEKAQEIAEKAFDHILGFIRPGVTERQISTELEHYMFIEGAEAVSFETIALSGANTSMPHGVPSDRQVKNGDFVLMDFGAVWQGYHSDMTRTVCVGEPDDDMKNIYRTVLEAQIECLNCARGGMTGHDLDAVARSIISDAGFGEYFGHSLGHGVGMEIHERPYASISNEDIMPAGSVVTVEPGIYIPGKFGVRIEDFVILTENGCIDMTKCEKNLLSL